MAFDALALQHAMKPESVKPCLLDGDDRKGLPRPRQGLLFEFGKTRQQRGDVSGWNRMLRHLLAGTRRQRCDQPDRSAAVSYTHLDVYKRQGVEIFHQIVDMSLDRSGAFDVSDMNGVEPMRQARQAPKTCAGAAVPESPLGALEFAEWMDTEVVAESADAKATRRLQGEMCIRDRPQAAAGCREFASAHRPE